MSSVFNLKRSFPSLIDKAEYIQRMYDDHHSTLFEYQELIRSTNIRSIEINNNEILITTKDRGIRLVAIPQDRRIAPIALLNFDDYEKAETNMINRLVSDGDTIFDVGANIGWHSLNLAASKRASKIYAFEPIPNTYKYLLRNLEINCLSNIEAYNFGFSSESGEFDLYYYPEGSGNASLSNLSDRDSVTKVNCKLDTLDSFAERNKLKVDFIKCDVEGAELLVFKGGLRTIERDKPVIFSEILRKWSAKFDYDPNDIFNLFFSLGYKAYTIDATLLTPFYGMDDATVSTNFFFIHTEKHGSLSLASYQI